MKVGRCPVCQARMVLIKVYRCHCRQLHREIALLSSCPAPSVDLVIRRHGCGRRLRPLDPQELKTA